MLPRLTDGHYDLVFCDGDKREYGDYLSEALRLPIAQGFDRREVMAALCDVIQDAHKDGLWVVGHNVLRYDLPVLQNEFFREGLLWIWRDLKVLDTGAVVKAAQISERPHYNESFDGFQLRVLNTPRKVAWSLDKYCVAAYALAEYGVDTRLQHYSAGYDCFVTAALCHRLQSAAVKREVQQLDNPFVSPLLV